MSAEVGIFVENQRLKDALFAYIEKTNKTLSDAVNKTAKDIAFLAMSRDYTKESSMSDIERLGVTKKVDTFKSVRMADPIKGKASRLRVKTGSKWKNFAGVGTFKLANWIMKNQGLPPLGNTKKGIAGRGFGGKMQKSGKAGTIGQIAQNLIAARKRSIGFIRVGWSAAVKAFGGEPTRGDFGDATMRRLGGAIPSKKTINNIAEAVIFNRTGRYDIRYFPARKRPISGAILIGLPGLRKAIKDKTDDLINFVKSESKKNWKNR